MGLLRDLPQSLWNYSRAPKGYGAATASQSFPGGWYWASDVQIKQEKGGSEGSQEPVWAVVGNLGNWESRERLCEGKQEVSVCICRGRDSVLLEKVQTSEFMDLNLLSQIYGMCCIPES